MQGRHGEIKIAKSPTGPLGDRHLPRFSRLIDDVGSRCLAFGPTLYDRLREEAAVNLTLPVQLCLRENALASGLQKEAILLLAVKVVGVQFDAPFRA
jgi:hypothetical protein